MRLPPAVPAIVRRLWMQPGLTLTAISAFAIGIGFTTTMFGIVHGGTRALPFDQPGELVLVENTVRGSDAQIQPFTFARWLTALRSYDGIGAWRTDSVNVSGDGLPDRLDAVEITPNSLNLLGVVPAMGRPLVASDARTGAPRVALISDVVWRTRFDRDAAIVGKTIRLDGVAHTIVGVMPPRFGFPINAKIWTPLRLEAGAAPGAGDPLQVFGRLSNGVALDRAEQELSVELARLAAAHPAAYADHLGRVRPFIELETPKEVQRGLQVLVTAVSLAFLVACANVANLLLARAAARTRETAVRTALGANRARIVRETVMETLLFAGISAVIGLAMAAIGLRVFAAATAGVLEAFWVDFRTDGTVVAFAISLALLAALTAGLVPALRATAAGTNALLQTQTRSVAGLHIGRLGRGLVIAQIALACGLFVLTATFVTASRSLRGVDLVFPAKALLTTTLGVPFTTISDAPARARLLTSLKETLHATPGLQTTAFVNFLPGRGAGNSVVELTDAPEQRERRTAGVAIVSAEFFDLAGARAVRGRLLTWRDDGSSEPVAVVNESFVRKYSPGGDLVGRRVRTGSREFTVVGVVPDLLIQDVQDHDAAGMYLSMLQARPHAIRTMTSAQTAPLDAFPALRAAVHQVAADLPVLEPASLYDAIYADKQVLDVMSALFLAFGLGTVFLAVIGLFAVLSFAVTARTREFGVRMALGAAPRHLVSLVVSRGVRQLGWGLAIGLVIAFAVSRALAATLDNVPAAGPGVFAIIVLTIAAGAALAMWRPVWRVARLSPLDALRDQ